MSTGPGAERFDERRLLVALFGAGTAAFAQLYAPQSVLPDAARDLATSASATALLVSAATLGLAVGVLPWAWVADRIGRVRAMTIAMLGATAVGLAVPFAPSFGLLVAGRAVEGLLVAGVPAVAMAYLTEMLPASVVRRVRGRGTYVAGTSMGGPPGAARRGWRRRAVRLARRGGRRRGRVPDRGRRVRLARAAGPRPEGFRGGSRCRWHVRRRRARARGVRARRARRRQPTVAGRPSAPCSARACSCSTPRACCSWAASSPSTTTWAFASPDEPFGLSSGVVSLVFLAYLAGDVVVGAYGAASSCGTAGVGC